MKAGAGETRRDLNHSSSEDEFHAMARRSLPDRLFDFRRSASGSVAVQAAFLILLALGFIALGVEASQLLLEQRKQQSVADSAAMAAASAVKLGVSDLQGEARAVAAQLGYRNGANNVTVTAVNPPSAGAHAGDSQYVEVKVKRAYTPGLMQLFRQGSVTVQARAVAKAGQSSAACILALSGSGTAISMANNSSLTLPGCGVATNSTSGSSISLGNNAIIGGNVTTAGDISGSGTVTGTVTKQASAATDPYASVSFTTPAGPNPSTSGSTLSPGVYTSGWTFGNNTTKTLEAGVYYVKSGISFGNNVTINGTGVTIVIDGNYAISSGNGLALNLSAPTSGLTKGIALYSSKNNSSSVTQTFSNNATLNVTGALYFPSQSVQLDNNVSTTGPSCTQIVANKLILSNNATITLKPSCTGVGTTDIGSSSNASLAE
jgi:Flp pilus assembly protein TadG